MDLSAKQREFEELKTRVQQLEGELAHAAAAPWRPGAGAGYPAYQATAGFVLGMAAAMVALLVNIIGATIVGKHPLELIRVYLTFPLGEQALLLGDPARVANAADGMILAFGCCLYLATGMVLGSLMHVILARTGGGLARRLAVASVAVLVIWLVGFYGILSWLQPLLFGGNWIVDPRYLPAWVAAGTHLVFGWTMAALYPLGRFVPYQPVTEKS